MAASFAICVDDKMIGEAVLFDFDYQGSGQAAIRLHGKYHGQGIGSEAVALLIELSRRMGLKTLRAEIKTENLPSLAMTRRYFSETGSDGEKVYFTLSL